MDKTVSICIAVDANGKTSFSIEQDGVKRSANFGKGYSSFSVGESGCGGIGISETVRKLAREVRGHLHECACLLDIDALETRHNG